MDIRGRCDYAQHRKDFKMCSARIDTALFHLQNDYETYRMVENAKNRRSATAYVRAFLLKTIKLTRKDANEVIKLYWEEAGENTR